MIQAASFALARDARNTHLARYSMSDTVSDSLSLITGIQSSMPYTPCQTGKDVANAGPILECSPSGDPPIHDMMPRAGGVFS